MREAARSVPAGSRTRRRSTIVAVLSNDGVEALGEPSTATLATAGGTDVVMGLYGPDDRTTLLAFDDDSGTGLNARIRRLLPAGRYWVRVRHWHPEGQGSYRLRLDLL